ncbi:UDP-galactopyranose mutase [Paenibacillus hamazuiensis]|uniref:UDP-galactopyranose mutase n=1 Tax=Paenibacillus hamazuiensis TaxID=2936508 RepID=UPI00200D6078|nr:UDP-galactopyranose mutase [Paenibacillus hamazuiensis]
MNYDFLVVGAGFAGCVIAERLASAGYKIVILDKRPHIGGNAFDEFDSNGILIHKYGPHIFHTNSKQIFDYLSNFTQWRNYEHKVLAKIEDHLLPIPINRTTINKLYNLDLDEDEVKDFYEKVREPRNPILTSEDVVVNTVGYDLFNKFYKGYTQKQWGLKPSELSSGVAARIPVRSNDDDRYFTDTFQAMPLNGYTKMFEKMLEHLNIEVILNVDYFEIKNKFNVNHTIYTGPIDVFYNYCYGKLPYRSLNFVHEHFENIIQYQPVGTVNFPNDYDYTRITEFKHLTGQSHSGTSIVKEYPQSEGEPYYPIPRPENDALYKKYRELADAEKNVTFVGRLAQYRYYNMDQVVGAALTAADKLLTKLGEN